MIVRFARAEIHADSHGGDPEILRGTIRQVHVGLAEQVGLLHFRQNPGQHGPFTTGRVVVDGKAERQSPSTLVIVVQGQSDLLEVVFALRPASRLASRLHGWHKQRDENGDDGDDHQQLNQCESLSAFHAETS